MIPELIKRFVEPGIVRFVSREFPLNSIHPLAQKAAEAAVCAGKQDKYFEMHDRLFERTDEWSADGADTIQFYKQYASDLGLDAAAFGQCLDGGEAALEVQADLMAGEALGVSATPYFFVNDLPLRGGLGIDALGRLIEYVAAGGVTPEIVPQPGDYHLRGNPQTAQAITVAFVDYANPDSAKHALDVLPKLVSEYVDTGGLLYVLHPWSDKAGSPSALAAMAAECAGQQGKYWEMHDQLFKEQKAWTAAEDPAASFAGYASALGLDEAAFEACMGSDATRLLVDAGTVVGMLYGVPGAPVFLFNNGQGQQGSPTFEEFQQIIASILQQ